MNFRQFAFAAALAIAPAAAGAATIVYETAGDALVDDFSSPDIFADFFDDGLDDVDVSASGSFVSGDFAGALLVSDSTGELLVSDLLLSAVIGRSGGTSQTLTAVFGDLAGIAAGRFGSTATAIFRFDPSNLTDGILAPVDVAILSDLAPVPLPASLPLMLAGLGATLVCRRKRS